MEYLVPKMNRGVTAVVVAFGAALAVLLVGCSSSDNPGADGPIDTGAVQAVDTEEFAAVVDSGAAVIDVRTPEEFAAGHIEGAVNIDVNGPDFDQRIAELDTSQTYAVYCRSGNRSAVATQLMAQQGFTSLYDLSGGIVAWEDAGLPVV
jgi:phage shock protein E